MGPVPWTVNAEIYPNWSRSIGTSASTTTNWLSNLLVSLTFLHLTRYITRYGAFSFYLFLATCGWIFIFLFLPETRGQTLEEVEGLFKGRSCPPPGLSKRTPQPTWFMIMNFFFLTAIYSFLFVHYTTTTLLWAGT